MAASTLKEGSAMGANVRSEISRLEIKGLVVNCFEVAAIYSSRLLAEALRFLELNTHCIFS